MTIHDFIKQFDFLNDKNILKIGKNYYYADESLILFKSKIKRDVFSIGIYLGSDEGKTFSPSPALIDIIAKYPASAKRKVFVNKKAESLFLYGRNILLESIIKNPQNINSGLVLIQNEKDENLGLGLFQKQGKELIIKNIVDKGKYLRKETKKK